MDSLKPKPLGLYLFPLRPPRIRPLNTILKEAGLRFVIYVFDHEPAHVHVFGDGEVKIDIDTCDVLKVTRMSRRDVSRAVAIAKARREEFVAKWREHHG